MRKFKNRRRLHVGGGVPDALISALKIMAPNLLGKLLERPMQAVGESFVNLIKKNKPNQNTKVMNKIMTNPGNSELVQMIGEGFGTYRRPEGGRGSNYPAKKKPTKGIQQMYPPNTVSM